MRLKIRIDHSKCRQAIECAKCLRICLPGVFLLSPIGKNIPFSPIPPKAYRIVPRFKQLCSACSLCVKICPKKAIKLVVS